MKAFTGNTLMNLEDTLTHHMYYAKILPIIKSSGIGKSGLVNDLFKERLGALWARGQTPG